MKIPDHGASFHPAVGGPLETMNRCGRVVGLVALVLFLPRGASPQDSAAVSEPVILSFDWEPGMAAQISGFRYQAQTSGNQSDTTRIDFVYDMEVHEHARGLRIHFANFEVPEIDTVEDAEARLISLLGSLSPDYIVSAHGELLEIGDLDGIIQGMKDVLRPKRDSFQSAVLDEYLARVLTPEVMFGLAADQWNALVGGWIDAALEVDTVYVMEAEQPHPMLGNQLVPFRFEYGTTGRVRCTEERVYADCVELFMRSSPDPELIGQYVREYTQQILEDAGGPDARRLTMEDVHIEDELVLIAEPRGLIPHELTITQSSSVLVGMDGMEQKGTRVRVQGFTYEYRH